MGPNSLAVLLILTAVLTHIYLSTWDVEVNYREIKDNTQRDKGDVLEYEMLKEGRVNFVSDLGLLKL